MPDGIESPDPISGVDAAHDNWVDVLAAMEATIASSLRPDTTLGLERAAHVGWPLPEGIGPLPETLRPRADRLVREQQRTIHDLEDRMRVTGRHLAALESIPSPRSGGPSAYLDVTG